MDASAIPGLYRVLSRDKKEIRLLEITGKGDEVSCNLSVVSLCDQPQFTALSYVWGDASDKVPFIVDGHSVQITRSLAVALRNVKRQWETVSPNREPESFRLWADALCINQGDLEERASQVQLMREIYSCAELVVSWMGWKEDEMIELALRTIGDIHSATSGMSEAEFATLQWMEPMTDLLADEEEMFLGEKDIRNRKWAALYTFFQSEYFTRVWIFQEVLLAAKIIMGCPSASVPFEHVQFICDNFAETQRKFKTGQAWFPPFIGNESTATSMILFGINFTTFSWLRIGRQILREHSEEECWVISPHGNNLQATDPRDHVYGLLGVANIKIVPDYGPQKTLADVYGDYVSAWLEAVRTKNLSSWEVTSMEDRLFFLNYAGIGTDNDPKLPSWVPRYHRNYTYLKASWKGNASLRLFGKFDSRVVDKSLFAKGVQFAPLARVEDVLLGDGMEKPKLFPYLQDFVSRHRFYEPMGLSSLVALVRLLFDHNEKRSSQRDIQNIVVMLRLALREEFTKRVLSLSSAPEEFSSRFLGAFFPSYSLQDLDSKNELGPASVFRPLVTGKVEHVRDALADSVQDWSGLSTFAIGEMDLGDRTYLGLVPRGVVVGDMVCVLQGHNFPVVLRKEDQHWAFVGECFVLGIMLGQCWGILRGVYGDVGMEEFEIW